MWSNRKTSLWALICSAIGSILFLRMFAAWLFDARGDFYFDFNTGNMFLNWMVCRFMLIVGLILAICSIRVRRSQLSLVLLAMVGIVFIARYLAFGPFPDPFEKGAATTGIISRVVQY